MRCIPRYDFSYPHLPNQQLPISVEGGFQVQFLQRFTRKSNRRLFLSGVLALCTLPLPAIKTQLHAQERPEWTSWSESPHNSSRESNEITAVIVHYTAGGSLGSTVSWFRNPDAKVSSHYVVGRDGEIVQMVELDRAAWHAGKSELGSKNGVNRFSVGIEVCNWGKLRHEGGKFLTYNGQKYTGPEPFKDEKGDFWEPFTDAQYQAIATICNHCIKSFKIDHITGHSDISLPVGRKIDPGNAFDWTKLRTFLDKDYKGQFGTIDRPSSK